MGRRGRNDDQSRRPRLLRKRRCRHPTECAPTSRSSSAFAERLGALARLSTQTGRSLRRVAESVGRWSGGLRRHHIRANSQVKTVSSGHARRRTGTPRCSSIDSRQTMDGPDSMRSSFGRRPKSRPRVPAVSDYRTHHGAIPVGNADAARGCADAGGAALFVQIHPSMARTYGIREGDDVRLTTRRGTAFVVAQLTSTIRMDTLFVPFHFNGAGRANLLTNPALDPVSRMPEFKVCAARIEKGRSL